VSTVRLESKNWPMRIGGEWVRTGSPRTVTLPYDGTPVGTVYDADAATLERAIVAAQAGATDMARLPQYQRAELLERLSRLLEREAAEFAGLISSECGKPLREARAEVERSVQTLVASAVAARQLRGEVVPMDAAPIGKGRWGMTVREPLGVIGAITPFNFPLNLALHKIGPALAAGNAVVHKPAANTPLSALRLARLMEEAGVPVGAYNTLTGPGGTLGPCLIRDPRVAMITFTGSVPVGEQIRAQMGLRRAALELGSNSSVILEADCDLDLLIPRCVTGSFAHSGQVCISVQNIYVQEAIYEAFLERFVTATRRLRIGHPLEESTEVSSLITVADAERVEAWIDRAISHGARLVCGGKRRHATIEPAILTDVAPELEMCCKEVFGPVVAVHRYAKLDDAVRAVNASEYGLQAGLCTRDIGRAFAVARQLHVGGVIINDVPAFRADHMPYGGVKKSGIGREGPQFAVEEMTELKLICWR